MTPQEFSERSKHLKTGASALLWVVLVTTFFEVLVPVWHQLQTEGWVISSFASTALLIPLPFFVFGMRAVERMLDHFAQGEAFDRKVARELRLIADNLLAGTLLLIFVVPSVYAGRLRFHFEVSELVLLLLSGLLLVVAYVLEESLRAKQENESFV